jgi:hypothetical protein
MTNVQRVGAVAAFVLASGCASSAGDLAREGDADDSTEWSDVSNAESVDVGSLTATAPASGRSRAPTLFEVRRDARRCASPRCGGFWYKPLNVRNDRCDDGTRPQDGACYASELDGAAVPPVASFEAGRVLLEGDVRPSATFRGYVTLVARAAYESATADLPGSQSRGAYYRLEDNGIRCIVAPCPSINATTVNTTGRTRLTGVDFTATRGATEAQIEAAVSAIARGDVLAFGVVRTGFFRPGGRPRTLVATQFYVKVEAGRCATDADCAQGSVCQSGRCAADPNACAMDSDCAQGSVCQSGRCAADPNACATDADCTLSSFDRPVASPDGCYCGTCPRPLNAAFAAANQASFSAFCSGRTLMCPLLACAQPPGPAACVAGQCAYRFGDF